MNVTLLWLAFGVVGLQYSDRRQQKDDLGQERSLFVFSCKFNKTLAYYMLPAVMFVILYSVLPHKVYYRSTVSRWFS